MKRTPLKKKGNKSKRLKLFDKAWKLFSKYIRERDKGQCFTWKLLKLQIMVIKKYLISQAILKKPVSITKLFKQIDKNL